jgi:TP901 family phage tail tape measure protein
MISTKINIDTSGIIKAFDLLEKEGKLTAEAVNKSFKENIKIEVDTSDLKKVETEAKTTIGKLKDSLKGSFDLSQIMNFSAGGLVTGAIEKGLSLVTEGFTQAIEKGSEFEKQLNAVGAITGQSGQALDDLGNSALELSTQFGGSVNAQLGAFQGILSKFGGELANTPKALEEVTKNVNLLAKAGGLDATQSMNALTDAMLQFGVDVTNPNEVAKESARFMNLLSASAKVGAAEIPELAESILQVGVSAKSAGVSAEEITGAIQRLAVGGKKGSEAGIGLRNVLGLLQKQSGEGEKILDKMGLTTLKLGESLGKDGLAKTLDLVKNGLNNFGSQTEKNQAILQLFGAENSTVAGLLLENTKQITEFTKASTGTTSGLEQAKINMQGFSESMSRLKANIDAGLIKSFMVVKQVIADTFVFLKPLLNFNQELFNSTYISFYGSIFSTVFGIIKSTLADTWKSITDIIDIFKSMFKETKSGIDIFKILGTVFEVLGRIIGTALTIPFQIVHKTIQAFLYVIKEVILFVKGLGDRFNEFVKSSQFMQDFVEAVTTKFKEMGKWIFDTSKKVTGFLQSIGLLSKDKSVKDVNTDLKEVNETAGQTAPIIAGTTEEVKNETKAVKSLQQQYDELYQATIKLAEKQNFGIQYEKNIKKLEEFKQKFKDIETSKAMVDFRLADNSVFIPDTTLNGLKTEIDNYFAKEKIELSLKPKISTSTALDIIPKKEATQLEKDLSNIFVDTFKGFDYTSIFKKRNEEVDVSLDKDRASLLTSLQKNEIDYEEYASRLNEIDSQRRETQKEGNSAFLNGLNETFALSFESANTVITETLNNSMQKTDAFTTGLSENITLALMSVASATTEMALSGDSLLKSLVVNTIKAARAMFNAYMAPLLAAEVLRENWLGFAKFLGYQILGNSLLGVAEGYANSFKDGVINLQGAGTSRSDSIPAMLSRGESVINARSSAINEPYLRYVNNGGSITNLLNTAKLEGLMIANNNILMQKEFSPRIVNENRFNVSSNNIRVIRGR